MANMNAKHFVGLLADIKILLQKDVTNFKIYAKEKIKVVRFCCEGNCR